MLVNDRQVAPQVSFYDLQVQLNDGSSLSFDSFKGKKVMLVNTASHCGFTNQYEQLQKIYEKNKEDLVIIGFPANDFKEQEKGTDEEIAQFCKVNYGISFPLVKKASVIGDGQQPVYEWLTNANKNGWNDQPPTWNFCKYIVNEEGVLTHFFPVSVTPDSKEVLQALVQ